MSYGQVREPGVIEAYLVDPECPDDPYMTPDTDFWVSCVGQQAKAEFFQTLIAIKIIFIIILTILLLVGSSGVWIGLLVLLGVGIIGFSAFRMLTAERVAKSKHKEAMNRLATSSSIIYDNAWEMKDGRRVWKPETIKDLERVRKEMREQLTAENIGTKITVSQNGPGGSTASQPTFTSAFGSKVADIMGSVIDDKVKKLVK